VGEIKCGGNFSAWPRSGIISERKSLRCSYNGIQEKPSVDVYLGEAHSSSSSFAN
jgi:hypothetical protein